MFIKITAAALLLASAVPVVAQDISAGLGLSTFGPTIEGSYAIQDNLSVRGIGFIPLSASDSGIEVDDDYTLDGEVSTGAFAVLADYYPTGQGWRISGGLLFAPDDFVTGTFTGPETFDGSFGMDRDVAAMVSGGYQYDFANGIYISGEVGAIFSGFNVESNSTDAAVQADIADINADLDDVPAYPYLGVTVGFTF